MPALPFPPYHPTGPDLWHELRLLRRALNLFIATNHLDSDNKLLIAQQTRKVLLYGDRLAPEPEKEGDPHTGVAEEDFSLEEEIRAIANPRYAIPGYEAVAMPDGQPLYFPSGDPKAGGFTIHERVSTLGYRMDTVTLFHKHAAHITRLVQEAWTEQYDFPPESHGPGNLPWYEDRHARWIDPIITTYMAAVPHEMYHGALHKPEGYTVPERVAQLGYQLTCQEYTLHIPLLEEQARGAWRRQFSGEPVHRDGADWYGREDRAWLDPLIHAYLELVQYQAQGPGEGK